MGLNEIAALLLSCLAAFPSTLGTSTFGRALDLGLPTVELDNATVFGTTDGTVTQFLGIPFAQPPYARLLLLICIFC